MNKTFFQFVLLFAVVLLPFAAAGKTLPDPHDDYFQDIIYLNDGSEVVANIKVLDSKAVVFEQYDSDEPFSMAISTISKIRFKDGRIKDFNKKSEPAAQTQTTKSNKTTTKKSKTKKNRK